MEEMHAKPAFTRSMQPGAAWRGALERMKSLLAGRSLAVGLVVWAAFVLFLAAVQFSTPDLADNDGFYHIKLAYLMRTQGLTPDFTWLPLSILNAREYYDHHFLFHVALMPFTFGDLRIGAKLAAVLFASLAFLSAWNLLRNQRIAYASLWALGLLAVSEAFIYRMSIPRAQSLSLAVLMLGMDWLLRKKYTRLGGLAFFYVWLYNAFPLIVAVAGLYVVAALLVERRLEWRPLAWVAAGTFLGLLINPYFPHNIIFAALHFLPKLVDATAVSVGSEWFPYETGQLLENSPLALLAFISGGLALGLSGKRMDLRTAFSFLLACLFGLMLFQSRRFIEYFPPFALVFAAFAWTAVIKAASTPAAKTPAAKTPTAKTPTAKTPTAKTPTAKTPTAKTPTAKTPGAAAPSEQIQRAEGAGRGAFFSRYAAAWRKWLPAAALAALLIPGAWLTLRAAQDSMQRSKPYQTYAGASAWLAANTQPGERVFQTDWDDFPRLFYYNTHNTYLIGLDPTYMQLYDAGLYDLWVEISQGDLEQPAQMIRSEFGARYIVSDLNHGGFLDEAADDPGLSEVYRDDSAVVFQLREP